VAQGHNGLALKLHHGKKALCYIVPGDEEFHVNLTIRAEVRIVFLADRHLEDLQDQLLRAQLVSEGYVLRFAVGQASGARTTSRAVRAICVKRGLA